MRLGWTVVSTFERGMSQRLRRAQRGAGGAAEEGARLVSQGARRRLHQPRRRNVQDFATGGPARAGRPVSMRVDHDQAEARVAVGTFLTLARTRAIQSRLPARSLERRGLWINHGPVRRGARGRFAGRHRWVHDSTTRSGLRFYRFTQHPKIKEWARKRGQLLRHVIRLRDAELRIMLVLGPALRENAAEIRRLFVRHAGRAFAR